MKNKPYLMYSLLLLVFFSLMSPAIACCTAWGPNEVPVQIADQEVLIAWDAEKKIEHFVRRANFQTETAPEDFGFLVPTPTPPKLTEVPDRVFRQLGKIIKPKIEIEKSTQFNFMPISLHFLFATGGTEFADSRSLSSSVEVLDRAIVGGFEAAVLRASETQALLQWLEENEYDARPELREWLTPYVEKQWIVTAFKYARDEDRPASSLTRAAVCLSFETEAPFFPYRVPSDTRVKPEEGSLLRLYYVGEERVSGEFESGPNRSWNASTKFSDRDDRVSDVLEKVVNLSKTDSDFPSSTWLTAFEDLTWPGGAEDLYFVSSAESGAIIPPPFIKKDITTFYFPLDLVLGCLFLGVYCYKKRAKK